MTQFDIDSFSTPGSEGWIALDKFNEHLRKELIKHNLQIQEEFDKLTRKWYSEYVEFEKLTSSDEKKDLPVELL